MLRPGPQPDGSDSAADVPEEYGGGGGTFATRPWCSRSWLAPACTSAASIQSIVAHYILAYGTEEQKRSWLPRMARGELVGAIAMTEPGAGSDLQAIKTTARRDGDRYVINGSKTFITNGAHAGLVCLAVKTDAEGAGMRGISLLVVETEESRRLPRRARRSRRSACTGRTPASCSSTMCASRRRTCSAPTKAGASPR